MWSTSSSILGPLLFIIYVNDLCQKSEFLKLIMFADDTNLFCKSKTVKTLFLKANIEIKKNFGMVSGKQSNMAKHELRITSYVLRVMS